MSVRRQARRKKTTKWATPTWLRIGASLAYRLSFVCFLGFAVAIVGLYHYSRDLPSMGMLETRTRIPQVTIVDRNNVLITHYGEVQGKPVPITVLPDHVVQAFLATEDRNFYHHLGVNPVAVLRAFIVNVKSGSVRQGGSTITQQLVKNIFLTPEKTIKRKVQEVFLALQLEQAYSKDEILGFYLNNVYFGSGTYGIRAATDRYFGKKPSQLSVGEAALLAGLLKAPSRYSPAARPQAAKNRARIVLQSMVEEEYLSRERMENILANGVARISIHENLAPYVTEKVMGELRLLLGELQQDVVVHTSLDIVVHQKTQLALSSLPTRDTRFKKDIQVALVALEEDGAIRLLIGGRDYTASEFNRATSSKRQPGSAFKPFVYLAALEAGWQPDDEILDAPLTLEGWSPKNYKDKYYGPVKLGEAMARSLNTAAIRVQEAAGRRNVVSVARRLGVSSKIDPGAALGLGVNEVTPLELAAAYVPFANGGYRAEPYTITSVYTSEGKVLFARHNQPKERLIEEQTWVAINHMLGEVVRMGSGRTAALPGYVTAGKTGTTQESRDAWFVGYAGKLTGVVWLGKDDNSPMKEGWSAISGAGTPILLWKDMMVAALDGRPDIPAPPWVPQRELPSFFDKFRDMILSEATMDNGDQESDEGVIAIAARKGTDLDLSVDARPLGPALAELPLALSSEFPSPAPEAVFTSSTTLDELLAQVVGPTETKNKINSVSREMTLPEDEVLDMFFAQRENWSNGSKINQAVLKEELGVDVPPNP